MISRVGNPQREEVRTMIKIAVVTDDKRSVCRHFGRAGYYLVYTVEGDSILEKEIRAKAGHHTFSGSPTHEEGERHHHHGGAHPDAKHSRMVEAVRDCQVLIVGGMGAGARHAMESAGIKACSTEIEDAEEAVRAYLGGRRMWEPDCGKRPVHSH
jgi:predicted Fe-Mo cluster-binding NifX family protein